MNRVAAVCAVASLALTARGEAEVVVPPPQGFVEKLAGEIHAKIDAMIIARPPKLAPPVPIKLRYKLAKLGAVDLGGPLVAFTAGDLDGDGTAELYAVTPREVVVLAPDAKLRLLGRAAFTGEPATWHPRDPVATAVVDGSTLVAAVSGFQHAMRLSWQKRTLVATQGDVGFPQCPGETAVLARGRNYFGDAAAGHYGIRCAHTTDADGYPMRVRAQLSLGNKLDVAVERCAATGLGCQPAARHEIAGVGIAFAIVDVNRDGKAELVSAGAGAPGDPDALKVVTLGDDAARQAKLRKAFPAGVAGIAVTPAVIVATRVAGAPNAIALWRLE